MKVWTVNLFEYADDGDPSSTPFSYSFATLNSARKLSRQT